METSPNKQTSKPTARTEPLLSHLSGEGAECWLGGAGRGSLCVCPCIIFRAGYQQCQHENKPAAARAFSHDATSANSGKRHKQDSVTAAGQFFHFYACTVCFEHGLSQLERNFHPAVVLVPHSALELHRKMVSVWFGVHNLSFG